MNEKVKLSHEDFKNVEAKLAELRKFALKESVEVIGAGLANSSGYSQLHLSGGYSKEI
jgi:hypothetical protein